MDHYVKSYFKDLDGSKNSTKRKAYKKFQKC